MAMDMMQRHCGPLRGHRFFVFRATLIVRKAGLRPLEYLTIEMNEVLVAAISDGGVGNDDRLTENVTLNFRQFRFRYQRQKADGSGGPQTDFGFNIAANAPA